MSALPKAVQAQIDKGNEIVDAIYPKNEDGTPMNAEQIAARDAAAAEAGANPPADPPADPPAANDPPADPPAANDPPADPKEKDPNHKYKVLQGKYNAEVPRLQSTVRDLTEQNNELRQRVNNTESLLASMNAVAPTQDPVPAPAATAPPGITDEERAQFGPDLIDVIERAAAAKILPQVDAQIAPVRTAQDAAAQTASQAQHDVAVSEREKTLAALEKAVPNWIQQNEDEGFLQWLNENDAYAGVPRGRLLTDAFQANDANRVIALFKGFQTENAVVTPSDPTPPVVEPQVQLEDLTAPGTPKTGSTSAPDESGKRQWSRNDISAFYAKKNEFVKKGQPIPDELKALERDLIAAQREGRIR